MKNILAKMLFILIGSCTFVSATLYEDASDGTIDKWRIYDNNPEGAVVKNIVDSEKNNVISVTGNGYLNGFKIGGFGGQEYTWKNSSETVLQWSMKTDKKFFILVSLKTTKGNCFLRYEATNYSHGSIHGLGKSSTDGQWRVFRRDIEADLRDANVTDTLLEINGFYIKGTALLDDIQLLDKENLPPYEPILFPKPIPPVPNKVVYSNAENGNIDGWYIYDSQPSGATITNVEEKDSRVIKLLGDGVNNGYALGGRHGSNKAWNNTHGRILKWRMKYNETFMIFVSVNTKKGHRYLIYTPTSKNNRFNFGLGVEAKKGMWKSFERDLEDDLKSVESDNSILSVSGFLIKGSGLVDDVILEKKNSVPTKINLLQDSNWNVNGVDGFTGVENHEYVSTQSHGDDGSGSIKLVGHWYSKMLKTAEFRLEKGKHYTLGAYMKAIGHDKGQNIIFKISGMGNINEMNWNISKANQWEEIVVPYRAKKTGLYRISIFTYKYSLTTDKKYALRDGSNLDKSAEIYLDDFYVYESKNITSNEPITSKIPFESSHIRIDKYGNWSLNEEGQWKDFFPKFVYQDHAGPMKERSRLYSSYGFTGFTNMSSAGLIGFAVDNGMKYNGIQVNSMDVLNSNDKTKRVISNVNRDIASGKLPSTAVIMYEYDNEQDILPDYDSKKLIADWINENDVDPLTNKRARPINMLNGVAEGVARNYKNNMDIVGTYISQIGHTVNQHLNPVNTLGILQKTQNQTAPVSIMQLQCHYRDVFIPSIFKGIGAGAKGLNFWRAGSSVPRACEKNFEDNVWVPVIKDVFDKIDTMLPIIKEPLVTDWSASVDNPTLVSIGTRNHDGKQYIILANFSYEDLTVNINLKNSNAKSVRDFFTQSHLANVDNSGKFSIAMGHHNNGFLVLELHDTIDNSPIDNRAPIANAGIDKILFLNKTKTIQGSGTDIDGTIDSYVWKKGDTVLATTAKFEYMPTEEGTETLTLTVTDNKGKSDTDSLILTIKDKSTTSEKINLLEEKNGNLYGVDSFTGVDNHEYSADESHGDDGSGSIKIIGHWYNKALKTASFRLEKGKHYTLGAYMKAIGHEKGQNIIFKISGVGKATEMNWNVSTINQWEEIVMPYRATKTGLYNISIFTYKYALTTDKSYARRDGKNLDNSAEIYFDDFYVYQTDKIESKEPYTSKTPFESSNIRIDEYGNWSINEEGQWKDFFPKFAYQDYLGNIGDRAKIYSSYGFTGFTNLFNTTAIASAVTNGMKYNGIQINGMDVSNADHWIKRTILDLNRKIVAGELPKTSVILYEYDNEQVALCDYEQKKLVSDWINANDIDPLTNKRSRPINMLNGTAEGVARNYKNHTTKDYVDSVSTYIYQLGHSTNEHYNPVNTLGILQKAQNQIAPVSIMQLQCHYQNLFIPAIFKGIGTGAKGLNFWRAGSTVPRACKKKLEDNVWIPAIKDVFSKIDTMLPIIKEPLGTNWSATVDNPTLVSIETREHNGKYYLILANFASTDMLVDINLEGLSVTKVKDYFTKEHLKDISNNFFSITIGHHNNGYLVLELD